MKAPSLPAKITITAVFAAIIAGTFWMLHRALSGQDGKVAAPLIAAAPTGGTTAEAVAAKKTAEEITRRAEQKVLDYSDVRRRFQNGELTSLPPDLAPPPIPEEKLPSAATTPAQ